MRQGQVLARRHRRRVRPRGRPRGVRLRVARLDRPEGPHAVGHRRARARAALARAASPTCCRRRSGGRTARSRATREQYDTVQSYLSVITDLLRSGPLEDERLRSVARSRTLTVLGTLDANGKRTVMRFLQEAKLIAAPSPTIDLNGADLRGADLSGTRPRRRRAERLRPHRRGSERRVPRLGAAALHEPPGHRSEPREPRARRGRRGAARREDEVRQGAADLGELQRGVPVRAQRDRAGGEGQPAARRGGLAGRDPGRLVDGRGVRLLDEVAGGLRPAGGRTRTTAATSPARRPARRPTRGSARGGTGSARCCRGC